MFGHNDISHDHEFVPLAHLLENLKETVAVTRPAQKWQSSIARARDKVQVMRAVSAIQAAGHDKSHRSGSIDTRPCKKRKDGAPSVPEREARNYRNSRPPAHRPD